MTDEGGEEEEDAARRADEMELLRAVFPLEGELEAERGAVRVRVGEGGRTAELCFTLPSRYPSGAAARVSLRSDCLGREELAALGRAAQEEARRAAEDGEEAVLRTFQGVEERVRKALAEAGAAAARREREDVEEDRNGGGGGDDSVKRVFVSFHHLYSSKKRKDILRLARGGGLGGFSMPGRPGALVVEGRARDVDACLSEVRRWPWQRISTRREEMAARRAFADFVELVIPAGASDVRTQAASGGAGRGSMSKADKRPELGLLQRHLESHGLGDSFRELVGL